MKTAPPPAAQTSISSKSRLAALSAWTSRRITPPRLKLAVPEAEKNPRYSKNRNSRTSTVWSQESWLSQSPSPQASTTTFPAHQEPEPERRVRKESTCSSVLSESEWYDPPDQPQEALHPVHQVRNSLVPPRDLRRANSTGSSRSSTRSSKGLQTIRRVSEPLTPQPHLLLSLRAVNRSLPPTPNAETASIRDSPNIQIGQEKDDQTEKRRRRAGQRQEAIRELVATEASFAQDAVVTCTIYKACAEGKSPSEICSAIQNTFGRVPEMPLACSYYPWSAQEVRDIFLNIEDLASFSEAFAGILDAASGKEYGINSDDTLGTSMLDMLPRMQSLFQPYVEKHDGALQRLDSMSGSNLDAYAQVTRTLASGLTQSWDLNALLIKPVQRCLKYPLLLGAIIDLTPNNHPDLPQLKRANTQALEMAGALNEGLRARELISHITRSKDRRTLFVKGNHKKQSQSLSTLTTSASTNSFSRVMNKKWNRNSEKTRKAAGLAHTAIPPAARNSYDLVNELVDQFDALESCLISFGQHARSWSETACHNVRSCHRLVGAYLDLCRPIGTTHSEDESSFARILDFRHLLSTIESETSQMAIDSVETELLPPLEKLIYAFKSPRKVIEKRALRLIDLQYQQPKATQEPSCLDAGRDFVSLSERLLLELPHFLASIHRAFEAVLFSFAEIQQNHFGLLHRHLQAFSDLHLPAEASESGEYDAVSRYLFSHCRATGGIELSPV